ncbi:MAG TPA: DUF6800 family protein [Terriglobales bacterium]|nr:DUF6800 family protein [Terriglobales bacterium]
MSTPSRRSELRRRRARKEKVSLLRKRYSAASSESERNRILEKARKVAPTLAPEQFSKASGGAK